MTMQYFFCMDPKPYCPARFRIFVCCSGKRKSGKDFVSKKISSTFISEFPELALSICKISDPLKEEFAEIYGFDAGLLKADGPEKELVRKQMIAFGEKLRLKDSGYFCRKALAQRRFLHNPSNNEDFSTELVLVSDCRRPSDIDFFRSLPSSSTASTTICLRVECPLSIRQERGFNFATGVDDADSECALDGFGKWDFVIRNDGDLDALEQQIGELLLELGRKIENHKINEGS